MTEICAEILKDMYIVSSCQLYYCVKAYFPFSIVLYHTWFSLSIFVKKNNRIVTKFKGIVFNF